MANIAIAALITLGIMSKPGAPTISGGVLTGAVIGFLVWFHAGFVYYGFTNIWNITVTVIDPVLELIHHAITGAVIAAALIRVPKTAAA